MMPSGPVGAGDRIDVERALQRLTQEKDTAPVSAQDTDLARRRAAALAVRLGAEPHRAVQAHGGLTRAAVEAAMARPAA